jgi:hypothetical protein
MMSVALPFAAQARVKDKLKAKKEAEAKAAIAVEQAHEESISRVAETLPEVVESDCPDPDTLCLICQQPLVGELAKAVNYDRCQHILHRRCMAELCIKNVGILVAQVTFSVTGDVASSHNVDGFS